jgi:hypothetical protein
MEPVAEQVHVGANPDLRTGSLIAGMLAGADTVHRMDVLSDGDTPAFVDVDSVRRAFGATKQDAAFGHAKIASKSLLLGGLTAPAASVSTPLAAPASTPLAAATRRSGCDNAASTRETGVPDMIYTALAAKRAHRTGHAVAE